VIHAASVSFAVLQALAAVASLSPGALAGLVAGSAPPRESPNAGRNSGGEGLFAAAADAGVHPQAAALPQQLLRQLLALVPHAQVPPSPLAGAGLTAPKLCINCYACTSFVGLSMHHWTVLAIA
jgi:hypothetical protein